MTPEDITYALGRILDLHKVHAGRGELDDDSALEIALRAYEGAGLSSGVIHTLYGGIKAMGEWEAHDGPGPFDYLTSEEVIRGVGFGVLVGTIAQEHANERHVKQLREALSLIAEADEHDAMFGTTTGQRIARVALNEVDDDA